MRRQPRHMRVAGSMRQMPRQGDAGVESSAITNPLPARRDRRAWCAGAARGRRGSHRPRAPACLRARPPLPPPCHRPLRPARPNRVCFGEQPHFTATPSNVVNSAVVTPVCGTGNSAAGSLVQLQPGERGGRRGERRVVLEFRVGRRPRRRQTAGPACAAQGQRCAIRIGQRAPRRCAAAVCRRCGDRASP